jgi:hypothetical protein
VREAGLGLPAVAEGVSVAKEETDKSRYPSLGGGFVTGAQYLAERMCERLARKNKKPLPPKFWNAPEWKRTFLLQLRHAHSLLKVYRVEAVVRALNTPDGKGAYSLGAGWLDAVIRAEQARVEAAERKAAAAPDPEQGSPQVGVSGPREGPAAGGKSKLSKLRGL